MIRCGFNRQVHVLRLPSCWIHDPNSVYYLILKIHGLKKSGKFHANVKAYVVITLNFSN